jgi:acyl-CoA reductase-like NAD-dependent aldehyde dehydrogenase
MTTDLRNPTVSDHERALLDGVPKRAFLAGRWDDGDGAFVVEDPGTAAPLCEVADAGPEHARRALDAAVAAQERWAATPSRVRSELLRSAFEVVQARPGCTALVKPPAQTPLTALLLADILQQCGLPDATDWGLVGFVHTRDLERALRVGDRLQVGMVGLNRGMVSDASAPFGGVKQSGLGREGGAEGLREYQDTKYLAMSAGARA